MFIFTINCDSKWPANRVIIERLATFPAPHNAEARDALPCADRWVCVGHCVDMCLTPNARNATAKQAGQAHQHTHTRRMPSRARPSTAKTALHVGCQCRRTTRQRRRRRRRRSTTRVYALLWPPRAPSSDDNARYGATKHSIKCDRFGLTVNAVVAWCAQHRRRRRRRR